MGFGKKDKDKPESRDELVKRLLEEDNQRVGFWASYVVGPVLRAVTNSNGELIKKGLTPNTTFAIVQKSNWQGRPLPKADPIEEDGD